MAWRCVENEPVLQRQSILGCWVLAFLAWFPASGTCASAPKGRRLLLTGFVFQNIPRYSFSLGSLRTLTTVTMWKTMEERDPAKRSQEDLLWTLEWIEGQACPKVGWIFFSRDRTLPFFLWTEPRLEIRKSPVHRHQESRKAYYFPFHMLHLLAQGWPWENTQMFASSKAAECLLNKPLKKSNLKLYRSLIRSNRHFSLCSPHSIEVLMIMAMMRMWADFHFSDFAAD